MSISNQDILFASLMGSKAVESLERFYSVNSELAKHVLPVIPFLPIRNQEDVDTGLGLVTEFDYPIELWESDVATPEEQQFFPLSFSFTEGGQRWTFPYEPMITIASGNNIIKRNVAKQSELFIGTIKERWSRKDFDITVNGALIGAFQKGKPEDCFPKIQMLKLFDFLTYSKEIFIYSYPLELLGITKVVVEDYSFPFTKGENVQAYELKLTSDHGYNLLDEILQ
jgi:hypothetical protein